MLELLLHRAEQLTFACPPAFALLVFSLARDEGPVVTTPQAKLYQSGNIAVTSISTRACASISALTAKAVMAG